MESSFVREGSEEDATIELLIISVESSSFWEKSLGNTICLATICNISGVRFLLEKEIEKMPFVLEQLII